jgi:hypothetical protein
MRRAIVLSLLLAAAGAACGGDSTSDSPLSGARTYYESLDLGSPVAAATTFADAFARDDFMTVWLVLDGQAQFRITQVLNLLEYEQLVRPDRVGDVQVQFGEAFDLETMEMNDPWYVFDRFMLIADLTDAFLIDLSGEASFGEARTIAGGAEVPAEVEGVDGEVTFRLVNSPSGRWRVHQVVVPGGDEERIPWSVPPIE